MIDVRKLVVVDFETSGFIPGVHGPRSIAAVSGHREIDPFYLKVAPSPKWQADPEADRRCGYYEPEWSDAQPLPEVMAALNGWLGSLPEKPVILAHNADFDHGWIDWCHTQAAPNQVRLVHDWMVATGWRCSMQAFRFVMDAGWIVPGSASLARLCEVSGQDKQPDVHHPLWDARACLTGYCWLLNLMEKMRASREELVSRGTAMERAMASMAAHLHVSGLTNDQVNLENPEALASAIGPILRAAGAARKEVAA